MVNPVPCGNRDGLSETPPPLDESRLYALLAYCFILCIVPLVRKKDDVFVRFHGRQGLAIFLCEMAVFIVSIVLPFLMKPALFFFGVVSFWGIIQALRGKIFRLPFIYNLSLRLDV